MRFFDSLEGAIKRIEDAIKRWQKSLSPSSSDMNFFDSYAGVLDPSPTHLCRQCGNKVRPTATSKLNGCFFLVLLFIFIIPGLLYLVWAATQRLLICPICKAQNSVIPLESPEAQRFLASTPMPNKNAAPRVERACPWCAEPILITAKFCKHCQREVS